MRRNSSNPSTSEHSPEVSVGVPVYNGARFLAAALDSLLAQTFRDFEIVVSDNASTDETPKICEKYVTLDSRIRYFRHTVNIGAPRNYSFVASVACGRYFKWASANDYCAAEMLERCVSVLSNQPDAVLCYGRTVLVDEATGRKEGYERDLALVEARPSDRFRSLIGGLELNNAQSGLIRLDALRQTGLDRPYPGGDFPLMAELALRGRFVVLPDFLLHRRMGGETFSRGLVGRARTKFYGSNTGGAVNSVRRYTDLALGILRAPICLSEKRATLVHFARYLLWDVHGTFRNARLPERC
jgi:glycosyltransferase involved in cell wall biosynthesis